MQNFISKDSPYVLCWNENSSQTMPIVDSNVNLQTTEYGYNIQIKGQVSEPVIIYTSAAVKNHAKHEINLAENASADIIEIMLDDNSNSSNTLTTTINCDKHSKLNHCIIQQSTDNLNISQQAKCEISQQAGSLVKSNVFCLGSNASKLDLTIKLLGNDAYCETNALAYTSNEQTQKVLFNVEHIHPNCTSKSTARGVLQDKSLSDFTGKIHIHENAKNSDADLQIKNILRSSTAQAFSKPELEIYNKDVKASHGSSTGKLDLNMVFYLRSRGIALQDAIAMLIDGFMAPVIDSCAIPNIAKYVRNAIGIANEK